MRKTAVTPVLLGLTIGLALVLPFASGGCAGKSPAGDSGSTTSVSVSSQGWSVRTFVVRGVAGTTFFEENTYVLVGPRSREAIIIDPGSRSEALEEYVRAQNLKIVAVVNTHGHYDHIGANGLYRGLYKADVYANAADEPLYRQQDVPVDPQNAPTRPLPPGELTLGTLQLRVIATPGHTPGSVSLLAGDVLFTGDTLFRDNVGRTRDENASRAMATSIRDALLTLPPETLAYPGHGASTTIGQEKTHNPFLQNL